MTSHLDLRWKRDWHELTLTQKLPVKLRETNLNEHQYHLGLSTKLTQHKINGLYWNMYKWVDINEKLNQRQWT